MPGSTENSRVHHWVETWKRAGAELEAVRQAELMNIDRQKVIRDLFGDSLLVTRSPIPTSSGLVEQQRWFMKLHSPNK